MVRVAAFMEQFLSLDMKPLDLSAPDRGLAGHGVLGTASSVDQDATSDEGEARPHPSPSRVVGLDSAQAALRHHAMTCPLLRTINLKD